MKTHKTSRFKKSERGMATLEAVPLMAIFVMLVAYCMGLFGAIHTGILYSIAARTYAFETFRNRTHLIYFRENLSGLTAPEHTLNHGIRFHAIQSEVINGSDFQGSARPISQGWPIERTGGTFENHNSNIFALLPRNEQVEVNPIWVMVGYGMCLGQQCGAP